MTMSETNAYLLNRIGQITVNAERSVCQLLELLAQRDAEIADLKEKLKAGANGEAE